MAKTKMANKSSYIHVAHIFSRDYDWNVGDSLESTFYKAKMLGIEKLLKNGDKTARLSFRGDAGIF